MKTLILTASAVFLFGASSQADLVFENTMLEFQVGAEETSVTADFAFRNNGEKTIHIVKYESGCTCMNVGVSGGKFDYAPGEVGVIRAIFDIRNYTGTTDRLVTLWYGENPDIPSSARLTVRAHIPVLVTIDPKTAMWDTHAAPEPRTIPIVIDPAHKIHVLDVSSSSENFGVELKTLEAGSRYEIVVTPKSTESPGMAVFRIATDSANERFRVMQAYAVIRNTPPAP